MSKELKKKLIEQCKEIVGNELDGRRPLNIAVIGPPGCGKSSFLNTIFASFNDNGRARWREVARMGDFGEHDIQLTSCLRIYPRQAYIQDINSPESMPTFYDITGLEDEEDELQAEMLSIFFNGKLKERENLNSVRQYYSDNGRDIHRVRQLYNKRSVKARVDRIIVVCTANRIRPLPVSLLTAIRETASRGSREIPIYGVLTYADKQQLNDLQYVQRQTQFRNRLGLINTRFKCIANYCAAVDPTGSYISTTLPELDIPVLELMTQVLDHDPDDPPTPGKTYFWELIAVAIIILYAILLTIIS